MIGSTVKEYVNSLPQGMTVASLPKFFLKGLAKTPAGKAALAYAEQNNGSFDGFEYVESTNARRDLPAGFRFCTDCYRAALAQNMSEADAVAFATKPESDFGKVGKNSDGTVKYGSYCKTHTAERTKRYTVQVREKQRLKALPELITNAQNRVLTLEAELAELTEKYSATV